MIELVSGTPAPQFGKESLKVRGLELIQVSVGSCFVLIDVSCFCILPGGGVRLPQIEDHWSRLPPRLFAASCLNYKKAKCGSLPWEPPTGYPNRYRSNNTINTITVVTNNRICFCYNPSICTISPCCGL
jgi:hypothetical protein